MPKRIHANIEVLLTTDMWGHEKRLILMFREPLQLEIGDMLEIETTTGFGGMEVIKASLIRKESDGEKSTDIS